MRELVDIERLIQGDSGRRRLFVVHEAIKSPAREGHRRAVVDFTGRNGMFNLSGNVMLSFPFGPSEVPRSPELEVLAWDEVNGVYNFYKLDDNGTPDSWKLAATSRNADQLSPAERSGTCLGCHVSGTPVMKELQLPWNNWHSARSQADYLTALSSPAQQWPVAETDAHFADLKLAEALEGAVTNSVRNFNNRRFEQLVRRNGEGKLVVAEAARVLRPLFETTEINFASSHQQSRLHPLGTTPLAGPSLAIEIPDSFFLVAGTLARIGISEADNFRAVARIQPSDYKALIESSSVKMIGGALPQPARGDTHFAWFTPELGFGAVHWIETLLDNKVVSNAFVAAVLGADLRKPIFSTDRARLLRFVPPSFMATADEPHPDALARLVVQAIVAENPQVGSVEAEFLQTLQQADPVAAVRARVIAYKDDVARRLDPVADAGRAPGRDPAPAGPADRTPPGIPRSPGILPSSGIEGAPSAARSRGRLTGADVPVSTDTSCDSSLGEIRGGESLRIALPPIAQAGSPTARHPQDSCWPLM